MQDKKPKVLIIDDSESILFLLDSILSIYFEVILVDRVKKALKIADETFDAIILDLMMPEMSGIEFIRIFRANPSFHHVPIIILTAKHNTEEDVAKLFELGANDYISKPFFSAELVARVKTHSKIKFLTESLIEANEKLKYSATHDDLTNIFNRTAILDFLENEILRIKRANTQLVLIMFDVDYFKKINDTHGHQAGDYVLSRIIHLIKSNVREIDLIGRYGGDEFMIILTDTGIAKASEIAERILKKIKKEKFKTANASFNITISLGLSEYKHSEPTTKFIERADNALYDAKRAGRNCIKVR